MRLKNYGIALLFGAGLLFAAGTASAQVVTGEFLIIDDRNDAVEAVLFTVADQNFVEVEAICLSGDDAVFFPSEPADARLEAHLGASVFQYL